MAARRISIALSHRNDENIPLVHASTSTAGFSTFDSTPNPPTPKRKLSITKFISALKSRRGSRGDSVANGSGLKSPEHYQKRDSQYDNPLYVPPAPKTRVRGRTKMTKLSWLTLPVRKGYEGVPLPCFVVQSNPGATDFLELCLHSTSGNLEGGAGAICRGRCFTNLRPATGQQPSVAVFSDITIRRAGQYVVEIRNVSEPEFSIFTDYSVSIESNWVQKETCENGTAWRIAGGHDFHVGFNMLG